MKISSGLQNSPMKPSTNAKPCPIEAAISVARRRPSFGRQQRAQHAPAVHREGRNHVEQGEKQVDRRQPVDRADLRALHRGEVAPISCWRPRTRPAQAMTTLTSGPAIAIRNSSRGFSGMRSSRATPPIGSSVTSGVATPKARAVKMWPNSCASTQRKSSTRKMRPLQAASAPPAPVARAENPDEEQEEGDMDTHLRAGDRADIERPGHETSTFVDPAGKRLPADCERLPRPAPSAGKLERAW